MKLFTNTTSPMLFEIIGNLIKGNHGDHEFGKISTTLFVSLPPRTPLWPTSGSKSLEQEGIRCQVLGDYLDAGFGDIPGFRPRSGSRLRTLPGPKRSSVSIKTAPKRQLSLRKTRKYQSALTVSQIPLQGTI